MRNVLASILTSILLAIMTTDMTTSTAAVVDYKKILRKKVELELARSQCQPKDKWEFVDYPTNNFGLLTVYEVPSGGGSISFQTDMWNTIGFSDDQVPTDFKTWKNMDGFAAVGENGAQSMLNEDEKKALGLNFLLPKLYNVLKLGVGVDNSKDIIIDMKLGTMYPRCLRKPLATSFLNGIPHNGKTVDPTIKQKFGSRSLAIVVGDVVIQDMTVTITANVKAKQSLDAEFGPQVGSGVTNKILGDSKFIINGSRDTQGKYTFTISSPVIVARLIKKQPATGALEGGDSTWSKWNSPPQPITWSGAFKL
jgi:hypothetical protein